MKFRPLHDRVAVKRIEAEDKTAGGIIIPDTAKEKPSQGEVIAVGRGEAGKLISIDVQVGDRVLFGKWSGTEVKIDGQDLLIMKIARLATIRTKKNKVLITSASDAGSERAPLCTVKKHRDGTALSSAG